LSSKLIIQLQSEGLSPPFFVIPSAGSTPLALIHLARSLSPQRPVYSFMAAGMEDGQAPHFSIEDMAAAYLAEIRNVQESGPYFLAGHCFGAAPSMEIAAQMRESGQSVAVLALMDSVAPPRAEHLAKILTSGGTIDEADPATMFPPEAARAVSLSWTHVVEQLSRLPEPQATHYGRITTSHLRAGARYRARTLDIPVVLFRSATHAPATFQDWRQLTTAGYEELSVPGDSISMLIPPHVQQLGSALGEVLGRFEVTR
jgi:thioesterase domain-containing protein